MFGVQPNVLVVAPSRGWNTVKDLVAAAKAAPGKLNFASAGIGSASHWAAARLNLATGIQTQHITFRGAEGLNELIAGRERDRVHARANRPYAATVQVAAMIAGARRVAAGPTASRAAHVRARRDQEKTGSSFSS